MPTTTKSYAAQNAMSPLGPYEAKRLGAHEVIISKSENEMKKHENTFDFILNTIFKKSTKPTNASSKATSNTAL